MNVRKLFDYSAPLVSAATILAAGLIVVGGIAGYTAYKVKVSADRIEVTGSAKETVTADTARWVINLETRTGIGEQQLGFTRLDGAVLKITKYLDAQGFTDYELPSASSFAYYSYPQNSEPIMRGYTVSRQVIVRSADIEGISKLSNNVAPFVGQDYNVSTQALELTYSKLADLRVKLLSDAIKDAKARADAIAADSGRTVGALRNASSGVVQVLPQGGIEVSDYGSYDTQSKEKDVMVTVRASFEL